MSKPVLVVMEVEQLQPFSIPGTLAVGSGVSRFRFPFNAVLLGVTASIGTAPTGQSAIFDVNKNGATIYSTQANRPTITAGANATTTEPTPDITTITAGDYLTIDRDQVGSGVAGADAMLFLRYRRV